MSETVTLGEVCAIQARQVDPTRSEYAALPHIGPENIEGGTGRLLAVRTAAEDGMTSGKYLFEAGDILYSKIRPYLRKAVIAPFKGLCSADVYPLRIRDAVADPRYLLWLLLSGGFTRYANECSGRARMPKLNREQLLSWRASLPSLAEQRRIAARLAEQLAVAERARAAAAHRLEIGRDLESVHLGRIFARDSADSWPETRVADICGCLDYGYTASADSSAGGPRFLRITDIQDSRVDWNRVPGCQIDRDDEFKYALADGDIVFARTGATTGKSYLIRQPPRSVFASYLIRLRLTSAALPEYVYAFFQSRRYWTQVASASRGGAQPNVNASLLGEIVLPLPGLELQQRVVEQASAQLTLAACAIAAAEAEIAAISALPAALLREAFNSAG